MVNGGKKKAGKTRARRGKPKKASRIKAVVVETNLAKEEASPTEDGSEQVSEPVAAASSPSEEAGTTQTGGDHDVEPITDAPPMAVAEVAQPEPTARDGVRDGTVLEQLIRVSPFRAKVISKIVERMKD